MKKITRKELVELLLNPEISGINGASFIGLDTLTEVKLTGGKSNPMQGLVQKASIGSSVMVFQNKNSNGYENMVRRRLEAEGKDAETFEVKPRSWGVRIENTPLVHHTDKKGNENYYLEVIFLKAPTSVSFFHAGKPIKKDLIQGLDDDREEGTQGGLDNKVIIRSYKIDSIARITINKEVYLVME